MCHQHDKGRLTEAEMRSICKPYSDKVFSKFKVDENGLYFSARLEFEIERRRRHCEKQRENINKRWNDSGKGVGNTMVLPLENENENRNRNENNTLLKEIISYLNLNAKTNYRATTDNTRKLLNARLSEGYTVDDIKSVIDKKCAEWVGTEHEKFLRPETLFNKTKFEGYHNQKTTKKQSSNPAIRAMRRGINGN